MKNLLLSSESLDKLIALIEKLPDPPREKIKKNFNELRETIMESRAPKLMVIGRRGAGKSSLINAIFEEKVASVGSVISETGISTWYPYKSDKGSIEILDTRGLGDRTKPESSNFQNALEEIKSSIDKSLPDVIMFLVKATEVDSHISIDIKNISNIKKHIKSNYSYDIPVLVIITQVDQLDPIRITEPPYDDQIKQKNINLAINVIQKAFEDDEIDLTQVFAISAYAEFEGQTISYSRYWQIEELTNFLLDSLPKSAQLQLVRLSKRKGAQKKVARTIIGSVASINSALAATPIPVADIIPITSAQIGMIISIGYIAGREISNKSAKEFLVALGVNVGTGFVMREAARALVKFAFPGAGNAISAGIAFAGTWALGEAAIAYFIDEKTIEETKNLFNRIFKIKKKEADD